MRKIKWPQTKEVVAMKRIAVFMMVLLSGGGAWAWSPYLSAGGLVSLNGNNGGIGGAAGIRYRIGNMDMRTEIEYAKTVFSRDYNRANQYFPYDIDTDLYMANIYADMRMPEMRSGLHFGLTAGVADYAYKYPDYVGLSNTKKTSMVYGATAGAGLYLLGGVMLDIGLRYLRTVDEDAIDNLTPYFNLRYGF